MEDFNGKNDQDFTNHVRVKRNEPTNDSIVRWNRSADLFDSLSQNSCNSNNATNASDSVSKLGASYVDLNRRNLPDVLYEAIADNSHPRRKRKVLSKNGKHRKQVKGNIRHSRHHTKAAKVKSKKHGPSKSSHHRHRRLLPLFPPVESENNISDINIAKINAVIEKLEIKNNTLLVGNKTCDEQQDNPVALPFVQTGKMDFQVRIEKMPTNESSFVDFQQSPIIPNNPTDNFAGKTSSLFMPKNETINESMKTLDVELTTPKLVSNLDSFEEKGTNNLMMNLIRKVNCKNHDCSQKTNNFASTMLRDADSLSVDSSLNNQNLKNAGMGNRSESTDEDMKSRAKRNQEITSKNRRSTDQIISLIDCDSKNAVQKLPRETKHKKRKNKRKPAAVRSIDEIKNLAERLMVKVKTYIK